MPGSVKAASPCAPAKARPLSSAYAAGALSTVCSKTRLCKFYSDGSCPRGDQCRFAHGQEELQAAPDLSRTKMCPALLKTGSCKRGPSCRFAHSEDELRPIVEALPEPALAAALLSVWQGKADRWSDCSTDASDGADSDTCSLGQDTQSASDIGDMPLAQDKVSARATAHDAAGLLVVEGSFIATADQVKEGSRLFFAPSGIQLAIRNTFFDTDDRKELGAARRCCSAGPRIGKAQPLLQ